MAGKDRSVRIASWVGPLGWLAALGLGLWVAVPALRSDPPSFAWIVTLAVIAAAVFMASAGRHGHATAVSHPVERRELGRMPRPRRSHAARPADRPGPNWYKGRSHSGERPQFD